MKEDNQKIEVENMLRESGVSAEKIDEILSLIEKNREIETVVQTEDILASVKLRLLEEPDWKKRAALAAMLISKGLE